MKRITLRRGIFVQATRYGDDAYGVKVSGLIGFVYPPANGKVIVRAVAGLTGDGDGVELGSCKREFNQEGVSLAERRVGYWALDNRVPVRIELSESVIDSVVDEAASVR